MARDRSWENATVLARPGSCPSVPLRGGKDDLSAFIHLVERVLDLAPSCRISEVSALGQTPWHRLASTMQGLQSQGLDVFFVMDEAGYGVEACQGARIPEAYFASD